MDPGWIEALNKLWMQDEHIDFAAEENRWKLRPFETAGSSDPTASDPMSTRRRLLICLTGFNDGEATSWFFATQRVLCAVANLAAVTERTALQDRITSNGGIYTPDLTRMCNHLVVAKPEGKKYKAAKNWKLKTVSLEWLIQSTDRGMILDDKYFDPTLPSEDRGKGAQITTDISFSKRPRAVDSFAETEGRQRKLRKTASMKLSSQRNSFLGDLLAQKPKAQPAVQTDDWEDIAAPVHHPEADKAKPDARADKAPPALVDADKGIFSASYFYVHGFQKQKEDIVSNAIKTRGGRVCRDADEVKRARAPQFPWHRFVVVPQETRLEALDFEDDGISPVQIVTEFFIERCMVHNRLLDPEHHALGRPFPSFPIPGFEKLVVCSAGFAGIDFHHFAQVISQLGGKFEETFRAKASVLVCKSLASIRDVKKKFAMDNGIPIVKEDWLWTCISTGKLAAIEMFMFPELQQKVREPKLPPRTRSTQGPVSKTKKPGPPVNLPHDAALDSTSHGSEKRSRTTSATSGSSSRYETARSNLADSRDGVAAIRPLQEVTANSVTRSESPFSNLAKDSSDDKSGSENSSKGREKKGQTQRNGEESRRAGETRRQEEPETWREVEGGDARRSAEEDEEQEEQRRKIEEEQRRRDEELLGFQSRVTSLIERRPGSVGRSESNPTVVDEPAPARKERRKRGIFGRAVSSVSITSNHSNSDYREREQDADLLDDHAAEQQPEENPMLTMTQVEYRDPEAIEARDGILKRMKEGKPVRSSGRLRKTPGRL